jgi:hypothetical protein
MFIVGVVIAGVIVFRAFQDASRRVRFALVR